MEVPDSYPAVNRLCPNSVISKNQEEQYKDTKNDCTDIDHKNQPNSQNLSLLLDNNEWMDRGNFGMKACSVSEI
jgi:hypothetical protein